MSTEFTKGPWRLSKGNMSNLIEGPTENKLYDHDDGFRAIANVQACGKFSTFADEQRNCAANISLIMAAPDLYEALKAIMDSFHAVSIQSTSDTEKIYDQACAALSKAAVAATTTDTREPAGEDES